MCMCVFALLTEATELPYDVGQGDVSHTLQLILDIPWQHRVAHVPGLNGALHQGHPSAATPLPETSRWTGQKMGRMRTRRFVSPELLHQSKGEEKH